MDTFFLVRALLVDLGIGFLLADYAYPIRSIKDAVAMTLAFWVVWNWVVVRVYLPFDDPKEYSALCNDLTPMCHEAGRHADTLWLALETALVAWFVFCH